MRIKKLCVITMLIVVLLGMSVPVFAAGNIDLTQPGSVTITMRYNGDPVPGGELTLHHIADLIWDVDAHALEFTETFENCGISLGDISSDTAADNFAKYIESRDIPGMVKEVDSNGSVVYDQLPLGLFLVVQNKAARGYSEIKPFLIKIPENGQNGVSYDVDATPKVSVEYEPEKPTDPDDPDIPQTGQLQWPVPVLAVSGLLIFSLGWFLCFVKRKSEK